MMFLLLVLMCGVLLYVIQTPEVAESFSSPEDDDPTAITQNTVVALVVAVVLAGAFRLMRRK